ncbi:MAG: hypothetical protein K8I82_10445, partial [Anaerolineae bacterium]|nr:hypothetical protein [Anaerolineae bacterium]
MTLRLSFVFVVFLLLSIHTVTAFPGDVNDEKCEELVQLALDSMAQGNQVEEPDCVLNSGLSALEMRVANTEMGLYPVPNVVQVSMNPEIVHARKFRRLNGHVEIFDAPNGNVIGAVEAGYNYVSIVSQVEGWVQIRQGQWVMAEVVTDADVSEFAGVEIKAPLERPFAWM